MGLAHPAVLDAFAYDSRRDVLVLAMYETRPWSDEELQTHQLQEKLNAYASFILDGEMSDSFPQYLDKPVEIQLRTQHPPTAQALRLLAQARDQLLLQQITLETILLDQPDPCACGTGQCG